MSPTFLTKISLCQCQLPKKATILGSGTQVEERTTTDWDLSAFRILPSSWSQVALSAVEHTQHRIPDPSNIKYTCHFPSSLRLILYERFGCPMGSAQRANILYDRMGKVWCRANTTFDPRLLCENWPPLNRLSLAYSVKVAKSKLFSKHNVWSKTKRLFS